MKKNLFKKIFLVFVGVSLVLFTYFLVPKQKNKYNITQGNEEIVSSDSIPEEKEVENIQNTFQNMKYTGQDLKGNTYEIESDYAEIKKDNPDLTYMEIVTAYIYYKDGRIVKITSEYAVYDRKNNNMAFDTNVRVTEAGNLLISDNLDFDTKENSIVAYNNVEFKNEEGVVVADKIFVDLTTKTSKISMYDEKQVKAKILK